MKYESMEPRLAIHAAEQPARKPNARWHGSKPTVSGKHRMTATQRKTRQKNEIRYYV